MGAVTNQSGLAWKVDEDLFVCPDGSCVSAPHDEADEVAAAGEEPQPTMMAPPRG